MTKEQQDFMSDEILRLSIAGAFQRGRVYKKELQVTDSDREKVKQYIKNYLLNDDFIGSYANGISEEKHLKNIQNISSDFSINMGPQYLDRNHLRIGTAQKLLNLFLKYLWCLGVIKMPPHCPFDGVVINALELDDVKWTKLDDITEYNELVKHARAVAKDKPLAEWELELFNKKRQS